MSIVSASVLTPFMASLFISFAPAINGLNLFIKSERFVAISGNPFDIPAINPPAILPKNDPRAYPIVSNVDTPDLRNSLRPGISLLRPAIAAKIKPVAPITAAIIAIPFMADGPNLPTYVNIPVAMAKSLIAFVKESKLIALNSFPMALKRFFINLPIATINLGIFVAKFSITDIIISETLSTICGMYSTKISNKFIIVLNISGAASIIAEHAILIKETIVSTIASAESTITLQKATIPRPISSITAGINFIKLRINAYMPAPATLKDAPSAVKPVASRNTPAPTKAIPIPNAETAAEIKSIGFVKAFKITADAPSMAITEAIAVTPFAILIHDIFSIALKT